MDLHALCVPFYCYFHGATDFSYTPKCVCVKLIGNSKLIIGMCVLPCHPEQDTVGMGGWIDDTPVARCIYFMIPVMCTAQSHV